MNLAEAAARHLVCYEMYAAAGQRQGVVAIDLETHEIVDANPRLCDMFGYELADLVGRQIHELVPEGLREGHRDVSVRPLDWAEGLHHLLEQSPQHRAGPQDDGMLPVSVGQERETGSQPVAYRAGGLLEDMLGHQRADQIMDRRLLEPHRARQFAQRQSGLGLRDVLDNVDGAADRLHQTAMRHGTSSYQ